MSEDSRQMRIGVLRYELDKANKARDELAIVIHYLARRISELEADRKASP